MPLPLAAIIPAAAGLIESGANAISQGNMNKKNRQWQEDRYRENNEYNTPYAQMQRFKAAGLNPHLIYGQGNSGNATMPAAPKTEAPQINGFADAAQNYVSNRMADQQLSNLQKQGQLTDAQTKQSEAQSVNLISTSNKTDEEKRQLEASAGLNINQKAASLDNTIAQNTQIKATTEQILNDTKIKTDMSAAQIANLKAQNSAIAAGVSKTLQEIKLLNIDGDKKRIEIKLEELKYDLMKNGLNPNDSAFQRIMKELYDASGISNGLKWLKDQNVGGTIKNKFSPDKAWD